MKGSTVSKVLTIILIICGLFLLGLFFFLPDFLTAYGFYSTDVYLVNKDYYEFLKYFALALIIVALWVIAELTAMLRSIAVDPFTEKTVSGLRRIGIAAIAASVIFGVKVVMFFTLLTTACCLLLVICSLAAFTLSRLFRQAVAYKQENELTI